LEHGYHPSLILPLWSPAQVGIGDVGYLLKPQGSFVRLLNVYNLDSTAKGEARKLPSVYGYGKVNLGVQRQDKRTVTQRGLDLIHGFLPFRDRQGEFEQSISRRYSFPLQLGHRKALMVAESTVYRYMDTLDAAKKWFAAHIDAVLKVYGAEHSLNREDVILVIGTLDAPDYALYVNHNSPGGQVHFNVFSDRRVGSLWGAWGTDAHVKSLGPSYEEPLNLSSSHQSNANKVSTCNASEQHHTLVLARLRFKPDETHPTSQ
jgi:abelson tyrosine-protein kinase 1/abelson tyrosine-protein kinase 2